MNEKLQKVKDAIKAILKENDVAGTVILMMPGEDPDTKTMAYTDNLQTSFSCIRTASKGNEKLYTFQLAGIPQELFDKAANTSIMLAGLSRGLELFSEEYLMLMRKMDQFMDNIVKEPEPRICNN